MTGPRSHPPLLPDYRVSYASSLCPSTERQNAETLLPEPRRRSWGKSVKEVVLRTARAAGGFRWVEHSRWRNDRLVIFCYHGVAMEDEDLWDGELFISPAQLESRLLLLRERYNVLPLDEGLERLQRRDLPPNSVAVTFDDGFFNTYKVAWPLLQRYRVPFTVYLTTYYCDAQLPIFRLTCSFLLWKSRGAVFAPFEAMGSVIPVDLCEKSGREATVRALSDAALRNRLSATGKDEVAAALARHLGIDYGDFKKRRQLHLMTPSEVSILAKNGVEFGLHTHRHRLPRAASQFIRELDDNEQRIRSWTNQNPKHFCYPSGNYRPDVVRWLMRRHIKSATTCEPGLATRRQNPLLLPRVIDHSLLSTIEYQSWLSGIGQFMPRRRADGSDPLVFAP